MPTLLSMVLFMMLLPAGSASAASIHDNDYQTTDEVVIGGGTIGDGPCDFVDISETWASDIINYRYNYHNNVSASQVQDFQDALDHGSYAISQVNTTEYGKYARVIFTTTPVELTWWATVGVFLEVSQGLKWGEFTITSFYPDRNCSKDVEEIPVPYISASNQNNAISEPQQNTENFLVSNVRPNRPIGYEGAPLKQPDGLNYVAMGDSFSSGEGNPPFEGGTDQNGNTCHRSPMAYPRLLRNDPSFGLGPTAFVACSGATTASISSGGSSSQMSALSSEADIVTITIRGNDVGFVDYAVACSYDFCDSATSSYATIMNKIDDPVFKNDLIDTYEDILGSAPNAQVYVAGYPYLATQSSGFCGTTDLRGAWNVQRELNTVIESAVDDTNNSRIHYVDPNQLGSPFIGRHLCNGSGSDFNGLNLVDPEYSYHPNVSGHEHYQAMFLAAM